MTRKNPSIRNEADDLSCIGVLLEQCKLPVARCHQCWFANDKGQPTLVSIAVFEAIKTKRSGVDA
jgi:hypothetical protein